ncbi:MAG: phage integrase central domain-containing protein [Plesiomonas sp.]|uniref:phage integrase central domain-containing protein n=1 Tax=Plesiomonas sp. TaxID=2486279 RepID=UPI003F2BACE6
MQSPDFFELAAETQRDYTKYSRKVLSVFGAMPPNDIEPQHIRIYMDKRGLNSRVQANREKSFMSRVFRWGYERGFVKQNPCSGVKQFKETARKRYITDAEYMAVLNAAPPYVQVAMEIAYLCWLGKLMCCQCKSGRYKRKSQGKTGVKLLRSAVTLTHSTQA